MRVSGCLLFLFLLMGWGLTACKSALPLKHESSREWQPSTLSEQTLGRVRDGLRVYEQCVNDETRARLNDPGDSRQVTDRILHACEPRLNLIHDAFGAENVPVPLAQRYMRSKRSLAAQQILRTVMAHQAMRAAESESKP